MMQDHRQQAARLGRDELVQWCDELIQRCHQQEHLIMELQKAAANLMVQQALQDAPAFGAPTAEHHQWAREVLGRNESRRERVVRRWVRQVLGR